MKKTYMMRFFPLIGIVMALFLFIQVSAQQGNLLQPNNPMPAKPALPEKQMIDYSYKYLPTSGREGGEDISSAVSIPSLPFTDNGSTCDNLNHYDEVCPYTGSTAPDVVYSYTPASNGVINIDLCGSDYDTKVYVYENGWTYGFPYACNDDYYLSAPCGAYVSAIFDLAVTGGNTYYIVIDGYGTDCGNYSLNVTGEVVGPVEGDEIATAFPVLALPFNDSRNTCTFRNDYDEQCPYSGSTAKDVVYSFTPTENLLLDIDLCGSSYDTKLYVYENVYAPGTPYTCNDDYYYDATCGYFTSVIFDLFVTGGNTYYLVIDGYGSNCGTYVLNIEGTPPPPPCDYCLSCSIPEGEPDIPDGGQDVTNGGCQMPVPAFTPISRNQVICGRSNGYNGGALIDFDWYEITLTEPGTLYWSGYAEFDLTLYLVYNIVSCSDFQYVSVATGGACNIATVSQDLAAGTYWLVVSPTNYVYMPGTNYNVIATLNDPPSDEFCLSVTEVPFANWAIYLVIGLIALLVIFRFWRRS